MTSPLLEEINEIEEYSKAHDELMRAHHFLYDLPLDKTANHDTDRPYVIMGINPGEGPKEKPDHTTINQETSKEDFHDNNPGGRGAVRWTKLCRDFLGNDTPLVQTELFFWSSRNLAHFDERYGPLMFSPHLPFCTRLNKRLLEVRNPKGVVCPGFSSLHVIFYEYRLKHLKTLYLEKEEKTRIGEVFTDGKRPWAVTPHWSGARHFTKEKKDKLAEFLQGEFLSCHPS